MTALLFGAASVHAAGFHEQAVKDVQGSDLEALQVLADKPVASTRLFSMLKYGPESGKRRTGRSS